MITVWSALFPQSTTGLVFLRVSRRCRSTLRANVFIFGGSNIGVMGVMTSKQDHIGVCVCVFRLAMCTLESSHRCAEKKSERPTVMWRYRMPLPLICR